MRLPKELPDTPYAATALRVSHLHIDEDDDELYPGTIVIELAGRLPGTEADVVVPFEISSQMAVELVEDLISQYRCLAFGDRFFEDDEDA